MSEEKAAVVGTKRAEAYIVFTRWKIEEHTRGDVNNKD